MLACQEYTKAIDMWSVGCIFAELLARKPFFPGEDYIQQLCLICDKLGRPSPEDLEFVTSERAKRFMTSLSDKVPIPLADNFPSHPGQTDAIDLLKQMLQFNPHKRISIQKALEHPFLSTLHNPNDEPDANCTFDFTWENENLPRERVQELIWEELRSYHPEIPENYPRRRRERQAQIIPDLNSDSKIDGECKIEGKGEGTKGQGKAARTLSSGEKAGSK
jgi:mitogen-activated protein kinase 1/3